jgi:aspartyl-tRNA synthetase
MIENLGNLERTHSCGALRKEDVGKRVTLMGWCAKRRDFGPLTFIDLRDREGLTQVVCNEEKASEAHAKAKEVRGEYVLAVTGEVVLRDENSRNPKLSSGDVEVQATEVVILNDARTLPFQLDAPSSEALASEDLRLKYRYLDLRRPQLQANLRLRHRLLLEINRYMDEQGFTQIETPNLIKSTPEGARDYIVPSRVQPGRFFALPQSPQIFKQICMIAGLDKYYQIARCFRDEDLRADRQPEFSQLDVEMSFATPDQIYTIVEGLFARIFKLIGVELPLPFPRLTFAEVMARFGSDKPDLRFGMELRDLSNELRDTSFTPFSNALTAGGQVKGFVVKGAHGISNKSLDSLREFVTRYKAKALADIRIPYAKDSTAWDDFPQEDIRSSLKSALGIGGVFQLAKAADARPGDLVLIVAGEPQIVAASLGALRNEVWSSFVSRDPELRKANEVSGKKFAPLWVTEFPMFEFKEEDGRYYSMHHPFTSPLDEDVELLERAVNGETNLFAGLRAKAYDAVINGVEVAGGSIRIHRRDVQAIVFKALGMSDETARARFGFFLDALAYGTPPHGGIASGIERTLMVLVPTENIRDVMAFPKTASAQDLMIDAPGEVDEKQLAELHLKIVKD